MSTKTRAEELADALEADGFSPKAHYGAAAELRRLAAEVEALRADAERWRTLLSLDYPTVCTVENDCGDWIPIHPELIVETIDSARKEQG